MVKCSASGSPVRRGKFDSTVISKWQALPAQASQSGKKQTKSPAPKPKQGEDMNTWWHNWSLFLVVQELLSILVN